MGKNIFLAFLLIVIAAGLYYAVKNIPSENPLHNNVACTAEAKLCPDGSAVGRTGPNCEFAACPTVDTVDDNSQQPDAPVTLSVKINETSGALGVKITPLEVIEDSRCPKDVVCIWAGTVKVRVMLSSGSGEAEQIFELDQEITTEVERITLTDVRPAAVSTEDIKDNQYEFEFRVEMR